MRVEFEFDKQKIKESGYTQEQIHRTVAAAFREYGLRCTQQDDVLAFEDCGCKDDYSHMWSLIVRIFNSNWFLKCTTACWWFDDEDDNEPEDVLAQARKLVRKTV